MPGGFPLLGDLSNGNSYPTVPTQASGFTLLTAPGGVNGKGAWTNLGGTLASDTSMLLLTFSFGGGSAQANSVDIGVGTTVIAADLFLGSFGINSTFRVVNILLPVNLVAGSQLAARYQTTNLAQSVFVQVTAFDAGFTQSNSSTFFDAIGFTAGTTSSTKLAPGTAGAKGAYTNLTASAPFDYAGFWIFYDASALATSGPPNDLGNVYFDIAFGAGNTIVLPDYTVSNLGVSAQACFGEPLISPFFPLKIPSGTQVSARVAVGYSGADSAGIALLGLRA